MFHRSACKFKIFYRTYSSLYTYSSVYKCLFQYHDNKSYCEDLTEGKFSFPIIHAIRSSKDNNQVISILVLWKIYIFVLHVGM